LQNNGVEQGDGFSVVTNWSLSGDGGRETTNGWGFSGQAMYDGDYALKAWGGLFDCAQSNVPVTPGYFYETGGFFYHSSSEDVISNSASSTRMFMHIEWLNATGGVIRHDYSGNHNGVSPADVWTQIVMRTVAPDGAASAVFHVETDSDLGGGSIFGDGFSFMQESDPGLGWDGNVLITCQSTDNWSTVVDSGATCTLSTVAGVFGDAVAMNWNLADGDWVQAKYSFPEPVDLSTADVFGVTMRGDGYSPDNTVVLMFADTNDVYFAHYLPRGINHWGKWLVNMTRVRDFFDYFSGPSPEIDWSAVNRFMIDIKRPSAEEGGGSGQLIVDHLQSDNAGAWPRQTAFEDVVDDPAAQSNAVQYVLGQQKASGLFKTWEEEPGGGALLYSQALVLMMLAREGNWTNQVPVNTAAEAADKLAAFLVQHQKPDGRWARWYDPDTGAERTVDSWVGDQSWAAMAMSAYAQKSGRAAAMRAAERCAGWVAGELDGMGKVHGSNEANVDAWWAFMSTLRTAEAVQVRSYLLTTGSVWDAETRFWYGGYEHPAIYVDTATWPSAFARHGTVGETNKALDALSFILRAHMTSSDDGALCGLGAMTVVTIMNEFCGQYVAAGGEHSQQILDALLAQQESDGGLPGAPDAWNTSADWSTTWKGVVPTTWLYFALTGLPFLEEFEAGFSGNVVYRGDQRGSVHLYATNAAVVEARRLSATGTYSFLKKDLGEVYRIKCFCDANSNAVQDAWEPVSAYMTNAVVCTSVVGEVDIVLQDPDLDEDNVADFWEYRHFGDPANCDAQDDDDDDGLSNYEEFIADTLPLQKTSCFRRVEIAALGSNTCVLYAGPSTTNSRLYDIQQKEDLAATSEWHLLGIEKRGTGGSLQFSVTNSGGNCYYRATVHTR
jgi:hypothetical protein